MNLYKLGISKKRLSTMPTDERAFLVFLGQVLNEVTILRKACLVSTLSITDRPHLRHAEVGQTMLFMKLLGAKLFEAWVEFGRRFYSNQALRQRYETVLQEKAGDEWQAVKDMFGRTNYLSQLRNDHVFHFVSPAEIEAAFNDLSDDEELDFYLAENNANSFYQSSDLVVNHAMLRASNIATLKEAVEAFGDQVIETSGAVEAFFSLVLVQIIDQNFPGLRSPDPILSLNGLPDIDDVRLPYFISDKPPTDGV